MSKSSSTSTSKSRTAMAEFEITKLYKTKGPLRGSKYNNDMFAWKAPDDGAITIMFVPEKDPFGIGNRRIESNDTYMTRPLTMDDPQGTYPYAIFCHKTNNFAVMNSDPEIIITD